MVPRGSAKLNSRGPRNLCDSALHQEVEGGQAAKVQESGSNLQAAPFSGKSFTQGAGGLGGELRMRRESQSVGAKKRQGGESPLLGICPS